MNETSNQTIVRSVAIFASAMVLGVVALAIWGPVESDRTDKIISFMGTALVIVIPALVGFKFIADTKTEATDAKHAAIESAKISIKNASLLSEANRKIETVDSKVAEATDGISGVHDIVNNRDTLLRAELSELRKAGEYRQEQLNETRAALARLEATLASERADKEVLIAAALSTPTKE